MTTIAVIQINSTDDIARNLALVAEYVEAAKVGGAQLAALPECFALMPKHAQQLRDGAEPHAVGMETKTKAKTKASAAVECKIQTFLAQLSRRLGIWLIAGSLPLRSDCADRPYNSLLVYDAHGENVARYDKIHLFDAQLANGERYFESEYTMPGGECVVQDTPLGKVGLSICYDLRFPEMYRRLTALGATIMVVPAAFTAATGAAHWEPLLRARAIENACYVLAPAQVGAHANGRRTYGHSLVVDPWGEIIAQQHGDGNEDGESVHGALLAEIAPDRVAHARRQLPCWAHRRAELFAA